MDTITPAALDAAERFVWLSGRLIDRHRFAHLFRGAVTQPVLEALRPYQNEDGGFGHALEPDLRAPISQPEPVEVALHVIGECEAPDDPMIERACDYLDSITAPGGGVPFVLPSVRTYPRAPWWNTEDDPPGALLPTAGITGALLRLGAKHPWVDGAVEFCWSRIESLEETGPYEASSILIFLEHVSDRPRAEAAAERLAPMLLERGLVALDPDEPGEVHYPLDFAPLPDGLARGWFSDEVIERHLDALVAAQQDDGGWTFNWPAWTPAVEFEWRAWMTIHSLKTLRAYGRWH